VLVERVFTVGRSVRVRARTCGPAAACPECGVLSRRVHSRYERRLLDTAAGGQEVMICLSVRRFFCLGSGCAKVTFAEQVPGLTSRHARRSPGLTGVLQAIALAAGGRAGARLSGQLAAGVSRMTLIRLIRALPDPALAAAPRVLFTTTWVSFKPSIMFTANPVRLSMGGFRVDLPIHGGECSGEIIQCPHQAGHECLGPVLGKSAGDRDDFLASG
jgi:hypothetical protein